MVRLRGRVTREGPADEGEPEGEAAKRPVAPRRAEGSPGEHERRDAGREREGRGDEGVQGHAVEEAVISALLDEADVPRRRVEREFPLAASPRSAMRRVSAT